MFRRGNLERAAARYAARCQALSCLPGKAALKQVRSSGTEAAVRQPDPARADANAHDAAATHGPRNRARAGGASRLLVVERAETVEEAASPSVQVSDLAVRETRLGQFAAFTNAVRPQGLVVREFLCRGADERLQGAVIRDRVRHARHPIRQSPGLDPTDGPRRSQPG